jgi:oligopeptide/dipeptide ABC transporter ATP-binding protein
LSQLLELQGVNKSFQVRDSNVQVCRDIYLSVQQGEVVGLVGESGSGKSTLANLILGLEEVDSGKITFQGKDVKDLLSKDPKTFRRDIQVIFQHPLLSLDSRKTIEWSVAEPLVIHGVGNKGSRNDRVSELLSAVALDPDVRSKFPRQLSGGQLQRVNIARAIALEPELLICDEPVSALDVSVQAQIVNLFLDIQKRLGIAMLFISHDLAVVRHLSDRIVVMYAGNIMEVGHTDDVCSGPIHPYTQALLSASSYSTRTESENRDLHLFRKEEVPDKGCPFFPRCVQAHDGCRSIELKVQKYANNRSTACVRAAELFPEQFSR